MTTHVLERLVVACAHAWGGWCLWTGHYAITCVHAKAAAHLGVLPIYLGRYIASCTWLRRGGAVALYCCTNNAGQARNYCTPCVCAVRNVFICFVCSLINSPYPHPLRLKITPPSLRHGALSTPRLLAMSSILEPAFSHPKEPVLVNHQLSRDSSHW